MTNTLEKFEQEQIAKLTEGKDIPTFQAGDTVRVNVKIVEGSKERIQAYEGVCIARRNRGINSAFTVRKISNGEGVERVFPLYSPRLESIQVIRRGDVRRAKLYYMRELSGKAARIKEKRDFNTEGSNVVKAEPKKIPANEAVKVAESTTEEKKAAAS